MNLVSEKWWSAASRILLLLLLTYALVGGLRTVSDFDMGWHLATGRYVIQHHEIPRTDVLSYTSAGRPWTYPPFAGVLLYLIYNAFGYPGLSWFCALACVAIVGYLARRGDIASTILTILAVPAIAARTAPRADLFSTVFFALFLGELWSFHRGWRARLWLLPITMFLWVNLHPGFIAGLGLVAAYLLIEGLDLIFPERRSAAMARLRQASPWLAATAVATLFNPWGLKLYSASLTLAGVGGVAPGTLNSAFAIDEYSGIPVSWHALVQLVDVRNIENGDYWLMVVAVLLIILALWKRQLGVALVAAVALYATIQHARYIGLFAITVVTLGGTLLSESFTTDSTPASSASVRPPFYVPPGLSMLLIVIAGSVALVHIADSVSNHTWVVFHADSRFGAGESSWFPERAASFIKREQLPGHVFEEFALGGFAAWRLGPEYLDFIDGRADRLNPETFLLEQKLVSQGPDSPPWQAAAERWNINVLLISVSGSRALEKLDPFAFCQSTTWLPVYMDEVSMVFLRNVPENRPWLDRLRLACGTRELTPPTRASRAELYDFYADSGALFYVLRRDQESEDALRRAAALFVADPNVHRMLGKLYYRQQRFAQAEQEYRACLSLNDDGGAWFEFGYILNREGRFSDAEQAYERAGSLSIHPLRSYMALAQVELSLRQPQKALSAFDKAEQSSPFRHGGEALAPDLYAEIAEGRAEAERSLGHLPSAIEYQQESVRLTPGVANRWGRLAELYQVTGQWESSQAAQQRARDLTIPSSFPTK